VIKNLAELKLRKKLFWMTEKKWGGLADALPDGYIKKEGRIRQAGLKKRAAMFPPRTRRRNFPRRIVREKRGRTEADERQLSRVGFFFGVGDVRFA